MCKGEVYSSLNSQRPYSSLVASYLTVSISASNCGPLKALVRVLVSSEYTSNAAPPFSPSPPLPLSSPPQGADTSMKCRWTDMNGLHYAVYFDAAEIVRVLLEHDPSLVMTTCAQYSNGTCLHLAAANLSLNAGKVLVSTSAYSVSF